MAHSVDRRSGVAGFFVSLGVALGDGVIADEKFINEVNGKDMVGRPLGSSKVELVYNPKF